MLRWAGLILALLLMGPGLATAQDDEDAAVDYSEPGFYAGLGVATAFEHWQKQVVLPGVTSPPLNDISVGFNGRAGYRATDNIGIELQFEWQDDWTNQFNNEEEFRTWQVTADFKLLFPIGRFQPYLTYGLGAFQATSHRRTLAPFTRTHMLFKGGGGFDVYLTKNIGFFSDAVYNVPINSVNGFDHVSLTTGFFYRFFGGGGGGGGDDW